MIQGIVAYAKNGRATAVSMANLGAKVAAAKKAGTFLWVGLIDPDEKEMAGSAATLDLHPLAVADAATGRQQPKIQRYPQHLFVVVWSLVRPPRATGVGEVLIFARNELLVTVQRNMGRDAIDIAKLLESDPDTLQKGAAGGLYAILADTVLGYTSEASKVEKDLEALEKQVFDSRITESEEDLYRLRQRIGKLKRAVGSIATALEASLEHLASVSVGGEKLGPHLADLVDDLAGTNQLVADQGNALDGVLSSHENNVARRQGDDTRKISAIAALLSVPAVLAGLYGMNFKDLPLTKLHWGWLWVIVAVVLIDAVMFVLFKRRKWL